MKAIEIKFLKEGYIEMAEDLKTINKEWQAADIETTD